MDEIIRTVMVHGFYSGVVALPKEFLRARKMGKGAKVRIFWGKRAVLILPLEEPITPQERAEFAELLDGKTVKEVFPA